MTDTPAPCDPGHGPAAVSSGRVLSVLVADDNSINLKVIRIILNRLGHSVVAVEDGQAAVDAALGQFYDVILMDVQMPVLDGLDATRRILAACAGTDRRPLIIALTAGASERDRRDCLAAGMTDYLTKPIKPAVILECLNKHFPLPDS